jgi:ankyrin repeat protein
MASQEGKLEAVRSLIRAGADVNLAVANEGGDSPMISAAIKGHAAVIKALAEAGADVNFARALDSASALVMASQESAPLFVISIAPALILS